MIPTGLNMVGGCFVLAAIIIMAAPPAGLSGRSARLLGNAYVSQQSILHLLFVPLWQSKQIRI